ncbi:M48 family metallopeptidase [Thermoflavimicrobium daqui]|uniref:M48 family peptidase n=1 Tax=Thermoflavimicrobium daqui TaxID=2137476 RepID=A0A364K946_9BACL|nr:SprT family zinc-dependent metalloprotease [Thermoflavimicrobium daqui]RAL26742.1 M48 family peptidase [Thermoflavimicrobium daqui]
MKLDVQFGTRTIDFTVEFRKRKTMEIAVEPPKQVQVIAPEGTPIPIIKQKVKSRGSWIVQKLFSFKDMEYQKLHREFVNGESFMYLGRNYSLQLILDQTLKEPVVSLYRGKLFVKTPTKEQRVIREAMKQWYRRKTLKKVTERVKYYSHHFKVQPTAIKVKEQQKRWASCTANHELLFNWRCVMAPSHVLDYIVVHEMCHMIHMNHSQEFWDLVALVLPDYERRKEWLKNFGVRLDL